MDLYVQPQDRDEGHLHVIERLSLDNIRLATERAALSRMVRELQNQLAEKQALIEAHISGDEDEPEDVDTTGDGSDNDTG
jgi:hypothetical protein